MKKIILVLASLCILWLASVCAGEIVWEDIGKENTDVRAVLVNMDNPQIIYFGSSKGIFRSEDAGLNWRNVLVLRGQNRVVNYLSFGPNNKNSIYAATGNGLYYSLDQAKSWKRIFKGKSYLENECTALAFLPSGIYLGTKAGLFVSRDSGRTWHRGSGKSGKAHILAIACNLKKPGCIYVACVDGVFKGSDSGESWERVFIASPTENGKDVEENEVDDSDEEEKFSEINYLSIDPVNSNNLYLATAKGVYKSNDKGQTWDLLPDYGLLSRDVKFLYVSGTSELYALTKSGIFMYNRDRWQELSFGLSASEIRFLTLDNQNNMYAACDKGLFKAEKVSFAVEKRNFINAYSKDEPAIKDVQEAAIRYAEVEPEKIIRWRKQAAKRAWLPKVTIDMDRDIDRTTSSSIWGIYGTNPGTGKYYVGPDDETKYNNKNWGVALTWELGDLIWSDDQTSIDVRSRLMVQLRDDILDEVTKLYFERIRVKLEMDNLGIEERKKRLEKELHLEELTASLDALTGGYFSCQLKDRS